MKRWKKIVLGVLAAGLITLGALEAATLRNKPGGKTQKEALWEALRDNLNTDGTFNTLNNKGASTLGAGTQADGYVVSDVSELTTTGAAAWGTLTYISLEASNTYFIDVFVLGQGNTETKVRAGYHVDGTFYRDGTGAATAIGTSTVSSDESAQAGGLDLRLKATSNQVDVEVYGSSTTDVDWTATVRSINVSN